MTAEKFAAIRARAREEIDAGKGAAKRRDEAIARLPGLRFALDEIARAHAAELGLSVIDLRSRVVGAVYNTRDARAVLHAWVRALFDAKITVDKRSEQALITELALNDRWTRADVTRALRNDPDAVGDELANTKEEQRVKRAKQSRRRKRNAQIAMFERLVAALDEREPTEDSLGVGFFLALQEFFAGRPVADGEKRIRDVLQAARRELEDEADRRPQGRTARRRRAGLPR